MKEYESIREQIIRLIEQTGISQADLAKRTGMSRPNLSAFVNGRKDVTTTTADALLRVLKKKS